MQPKKTAPDRTARYVAECKLHNYESAPMNEGLALQAKEMHEHLPCSTVRIKVIPLKRRSPLVRR